MLSLPAIVYFDGTKEDMRGSINVTNMFMHQYIVFTVDSSPNENGCKVIRCLPRCAIVPPNSFKTVELFTEIVNEEKLNEFQRNNHTVSVQWRFLSKPPNPIDSPHSLFYNNTSTIETETVRCVAPKLPKDEEEPEYTKELSLSLLGESTKTFNPCTDI